MKSVFTDHIERTIREPEKIAFDIISDGLYLIQISAKTKGEKQLDSTDDEDLRIEINNRKFSQLKNKKRYFDCPAAFSGSTSKGLRKQFSFSFGWSKQNI